MVKIQVEFEFDGSDVEPKYLMDHSLLGNAVLSELEKDWAGDAKIRILKVIVE